MIPKNQFLLSDLITGGIVIARTAQIHQVHIDLSTQAPERCHLFQFLDHVVLPVTSPFSKLILKYITDIKKCVSDNCAKGWSRFQQRT